MKASDERGRHVTVQRMIVIVWPVQVCWHDRDEVIAKTVGYNGTISYDTSRPDGPPQKLLDVSRLQKLGWSAKLPLSEGLAVAYENFVATGGRVST